MDLVSLLVGFVAGGLVIYLVVTASFSRGLRAHHYDEQYHAAVRVVRRHFLRHGTINLAELERLMDITGVTALRYLEQMERDRIVKLQGNRRTKGAFYTKV